MNQKKHASKCSVCRHPDTEEIESRFLAWDSPRTLEEAYRLPQTSVWRHAKALNLYEKRQESLVDVIEKVIEKGIVELGKVSATNLIQAVQVHAKLTGQWVDQTRELDTIMARLDEAEKEELEHFIEHGRMPEKALAAS